MDAVQVRFAMKAFGQQVMDRAGEGDYVFIQFGHNDEVPTKKTYTTEAEFKNNLKRYVLRRGAGKRLPYF